ncbi:hypothetical protein Hanom_Chr14g01247381 [Helianthus anomalus]
MSRSIKKEDMQVKLILPEISPTSARSLVPQAFVSAITSIVHRLPRLYCNPHHRNKKP